MPSITINISTEAHKRLVKLKERGDSFTDVILRETPNPAANGAELLERYESKQLPPVDERRFAELEARLARKRKASATRK